jgi:hypothetical protein
VVTAIWDGSASFLEQWFLNFALQNHLSDGNQSVDREKDNFHNLTFLGDTIRLFDIMSPCF